MEKMPIVILLMAVILLAGCTINPQDSVPKQNQSGTIAGTGVGGQGNAGGAQSTTGTVTLTMAEIAKHNRAGDCWMVIYGDVLDLSSFTVHPGGSTYVPYCGTEATAAFDNKGGTGRPHSASAVAMLGPYTIGKLGQTVNSTVLNNTNPQLPNGGNGGDYGYENRYGDD